MNYRTSSAALSAVLVRMQRIVSKGGEKSGTWYLDGNPRTRLRAAFDFQFSTESVYTLPHSLQPIVVVPGRS